MPDDKTAIDVEGARAALTVLAAAEPHFSELELRIMEALFPVPGFTAKEIAAALGVPVENVRPRLRSLGRRGAISDSGDKRKPGLKRHPEIIWRAVL